MLTEVMRQYRLARPPVDVGFFETEHHAQVARDLRAAIQGGRLIALTAVIGSGKTMLSRRLRNEIEREGRVIVSRALTVEKAKITVPLLIAALFYDLSPEKTVSISSQSERRERDLQELFRKAKKPVALFVDDAHDLHPKTLTPLKRLWSSWWSRAAASSRWFSSATRSSRTTFVVRRWRRSATASPSSSSAGCAIGNATTLTGR